MRWQMCIIAPPLAGTDHNLKYDDINKDCVILWRRAAVNESLDARVKRLLLAWPSFALQAAAVPKVQSDGRCTHARYERRASGDSMDVIELHYLGRP